MRHMLRAWAFCGISRVNNQPNTYRHMKQTLTTSQAAHLLMQDEYAKWSRAGAYALIQHLEQLEEDCGDEIEFDRVAIRCDWSEYESAVEALEELEPDWDKLTDASERELEQSALDWLSGRTQVITFDGGVIVNRC